MDFKIIKQDKNALFDREDITFKAIGTGATPTRQEVKDIIAAKIGKKSENIAVTNISSEFGKDTIRGVAHIYKSKEDLERKEPKHMVKRNTPKPKKDTPKEETAPVPATESEKPVEEIKEEATE
jgi:small subunit ribosomal protein S24e